jgi:hypothetical protein
VGTPVDCTAVGDGGIGPYTYAANISDAANTAGLPGDVFVTASTGKFRLSVTPKKSAANGWDLNVKVKVWDTQNPNAANPPSSTIQVKVANDPLVLNVASVPGTVNLGASVDGSISVTGAFGTPTFTQTGLPSGSAINPSNAICGSTCVVRVNGAAMATYSAAFNVTVAGGWSASATKTITVTAAPLTINASGVGTNADINKSYSGQVTSTGGNGSNTWSISGQPAGLGINQSGLISGTVSSNALAGAYPTTVTVTDSANNTKQATFTMNVASGVITMSISASTGQIWQTTSHPRHSELTVLMYKNEHLTKTIDFAFDGGTAPYSMTSSNTNWGSGMSRTGLTVTGDPNAVGDIEDLTHIITVNDAAGRSKQFTIGWMLAQRPEVRLYSSLPTSIASNTGYPRITGNGGGGFHPDGWASSTTKAQITDIQFAPANMTLAWIPPNSSIGGKLLSNTARNDPYNVDIRYRDPYTGEIGVTVWTFKVT